MNDYNFWQTALKNPAAIGKVIKTDENSPQPGFYRTKDGHPIAIWHDEDGILLVTRGEDFVPERDYGDVWLRCLSRPVSEAHYYQKRNTGLWHDEVEAVSETIGHNIKDTDDPEELQKMIDALTDASDDYNRVESDDAAAKAQAIRARLNELSGKADKLREIAKAPSLEEGRKIDKKWQPMIKLADAAAKKLRSAIGLWEDQKRAAERKRQMEIEQARLQAEAAGRPAPEPQPNVEQPKPRVSGAYGRAASVRTKIVVVALARPQAVYDRYKDHPDVVALLIKLAQKDIDAGLTIDDVETEERADIR